MNTLTLLPHEIKAILDASELIPALEVIVRKEKDIENDIDAAMARLGICIYVMPVKMLRVLDEPTVIFVEDAEVRVRILEDRMLNETGMDAERMKERVALALQGSNPGELLVEAMRLRNPPEESLESKEAQIIDLIFKATFQMNK